MIEPPDRGPTAVWTWPKPGNTQKTQTFVHLTAPVLHPPHRHARSATWTFSPHFRVRYIPRWLSGDKTLPFLLCTLEGLRFCFHVSSTCLQYSRLATSTATLFLCVLAAYFSCCNSTSVCGPCTRSLFWVRNQIVLSFYRHSTTNKCRHHHMESKCNLYSQVILLLEVMNSSTIVC